MTTPFRPSLRLKPSILSLFVLLTVPVLAVIIVVNYVSNDRIARVKGQELVERFRVQAIDSVREIFEPIKSMVRVAAMLGEQEGDFYTDNRSMKYFETILQHSPRIVSAYVGLDDGQFRQDVYTHLSNGADMAAYSSLLWTLNFLPDVTPDQVLAEHRQFGELLEHAPLLTKLAHAGGTFAAWDSAS